MHRRAQRVSPLGLGLVSMIVWGACGKDPTPTNPTNPPSDVSAAVDSTPVADTEAPPRPRSEPPPRPPLPEGIKRFDKDAITISLSGDGRYLAGGDLAGKSLLWDLKNGRFLWGDPTPVGNRIGRVVFAETGDIWVGGSFDEPDRPWRAWSAQKLERRGEFGEPGEVAIDLALDRAGSTAVVLTSNQSGDTQTVSVWKLSEEKPLWSAPLTESKRGTVAIAPDASAVAVSDDRGGLLRFTLGTEVVRQVLAAPSTDAVPVRVARVAWLEEGPQVGLWAAAKATLVRYSAEGTASPAVQLADPGHPIRGLHRVKRGETTLVAVTRPEEGGLVLWGLDGAALGEVVTGCRCESHSLSFDGTMAACGCAPASELRYGPIRWR